MPPAPAPQQNESSPERRMSFGSEIALQHGIHFEAKYIGSMEMGSSRAGTRCEILAAMRRVRFEFKARNIRKRPVDLVISVDGLKVVLQRKKKKQMMFMDESKMLVMSQPMYRVYYVAHDSQDPQIFSYVARDGASNTFKCNVFKCSEQRHTFSTNAAGMSKPPNPRDIAGTSSSGGTKGGAISREQQFYYLRLMAKPGQRPPEPIKIKFPRWPSADTGQPTSSSQITEERLEDQALAVVRTVGQAFELCNRLSQEQNRERQLLEEERAMDTTMRHKGSVEGGTVEELERRGEREKSSQSPSAQNSPKTGQQQRKDSGGQKRHSIFMPRRMTVDEEDDEEEGAEEGEGDGEDNGRDGTDSPEENLADFVGPSTSGAANRQSIVLERCPIPAVAQSKPVEFSSGSGNYDQSNQQMPMASHGPSTSSTMMAQPFQQGPSAGSLWNIPVHPSHPQQQHLPIFGTTVLHHPAAANISPSADPSAQFQSPFYTQMIPPTVSLHSPLLLSPYATFQMPAGASIPSTSSETTTTLLLNDLSPGGNTEAQRQLVRAHLEQVQQQAQVAACQVQLLRDQLNTETTARLEAQSKTHQLLNSNRELLEQVQQLVNRLQSMENRMTEGLMNHLHTNDVRHSSRHQSAQQSPQQQQRRVSARPTIGEEEAESMQEIIGQLRPRQLKPLRAESLQGDEGEKEAEDRGRRRHHHQNEVGTAAGDSAETDTDDSGERADQRSSGATAKVPPASSSSLLRRLIPSVPSAAGPSSSSSSILALGMPLLMGQQLARNYNPHPNSPSQQPKRKDSHPLIHGQPPSLPPQYRPPNDIVVQNQNPSSGGSGGSGSSGGKKSLRRFSLQATEFDPAELHHKQKNKPHISKGIFGKMEFKRMSFNTNPNKKSAEDKSLISVPDNKEATTESGNEAPLDWPPPPLGNERRNSRTSPDKKFSGSPGERRRSSASSYAGGGGRGTK